LRASASASGPAWAVVAAARSCSAWKAASLIAVSRWALRGARLAERLDVARRVDDLLDLQRVDDEPELLHLVHRRLARLLGQLVAVGDQVLDREAADDRAQVPVEDLADEVVHLALLGFEEARGGVRDRAFVVADLEDRHAPDADRDLLRVDAFDLQQRLVGGHAEVLRLLHDRNHERAAAGDDLEDPVADRAALDAEAGHDQRLVGGGHFPQTTLGGS
jgi:hypothetical protein